MPKNLSTNHPRIVSFYENHPSISFEATNIFIIELYDKLFAEMPPMQQKESYTSIINKLSEFKQDYMTEFQRLIQSSSQDQGKFAFENNRDFIDKMTHIIEKVIPPQQDAALVQIHDSLQKFQESLQKGTLEVLKNHSDSNSFQQFLQNFEIKYSIMLNNIQQPINSFLVAIENRINANMNTMYENNIIAIKESIHASTASMHEKIALEFAHVIKNTMPNSYNNSSISSVLTKIYKTAEIYPVEPNLFTLKRLRKQPIFIQSIHSDENVSVETVDSFIHLIDEKNSSGVLLSQCSGISTKKDFQIEIYQNNIVVYIHNSQYSSSHIELAVSVIDNLYTKLRQFNTATIQDFEFTIPKEMLDTINTEYQLFLTQKNAVVELFKENQKKVVSQMDELRFPCLDKFLSGKFAPVPQKPGLKCDLCKSFTGNNLKALAAHKRGCIRKQAVKPVSTVVVTTR
jgi:hypothetical protein